MRLESNHFWPALPAALLLSACSAVAPIAMTPPLGFDGSSDALLPTDRGSASGLFANESFGLGPYRVTEVNRDLLSSTLSVGLGPLQAGKASDGFTYALQAPGETLQARCEAGNKELRWPLYGNSVPLKSRFALSCVCQGQRSSARLAMSSNSSWHQQDAWLPENLDITIDGQRFGGRPFDHSGQTIGDGRAFVGFRFDGPAGPAAAVGMFSPGEVWLHHALPTPKRAAMTCALAGLLLHAGS